MEVKKMMPYKGSIYNLFIFLLKKLLREEFGKEATKKALRKSKAIYKELLEKTDDIGADNPMASNIYMCYIFLALWKASEGAFTTDGMRRVSRKFINTPFAQKMVAGRDINKPEDLAKGKAKMQRFKAWADQHPQYKDLTWDINFDDKLHKDGYYYYFTRCPIEKFSRENGFQEILPVCCELDHLMTEANHGVLIRHNTLAQGGKLCDYWIVPDQIKNPV